MTDSRAFTEAGEAVLAFEASDEALEAAAELLSAAHGTGHWPVC